MSLGHSLHHLSTAIGTSKQRPGVEDDSVERTGLPADRLVGNEEGWQGIYPIVPVPFKQC